MSATHIEPFPPRVVEDCPAREILDRRADQQGWGATMAPPESGNPESTEPAAALSTALSTELSTRSGTGFSVLA